MELERPGFTESGFSQRKGDVIEDYGGGVGDFTQTSKFLEPEKIRNNTEKDLKAAKGQISKLQKELNDAKAAAGVATTAGTDATEELKTVKGELTNTTNTINELKEKLGKTEDELKKAKEEVDSLRTTSTQLTLENQGIFSENENLKQKVNELESQVKQFIAVKTQFDVSKTKTARAMTPNPEQIEKSQKPSAPPQSTENFTPTQRFKRTLLASNTLNLNRKVAQLKFAVKSYFGNARVTDTDINRYLGGGSDEIGDNNTDKNKRFIKVTDGKISQVELVTLLLFSDMYELGDQNYDLADIIANVLVLKNTNEEKFKELISTLDENKKTNIVWAKEVFEGEPSSAAATILSKFDTKIDETIKNHNFAVRGTKFAEKADSFATTYRMTITKTMNFIHEFFTTNSLAFKKINLDGLEGETRSQTILSKWGKEKKVDEEKFINSSQVKDSFEKEQLSSNVLSFPGFGNSMDVGEEEKEVEEEEKGDDDDDDIPLNVNALAWF